MYKECVNGKKQVIMTSCRSGLELYLRDGVYFVKGHGRIESRMTLDDALHYFLLLDHSGE